VQANAKNTAAATPPLLVDARAAVRLLSICEKSLWSLTAPRGPIPCVRIGRAVRYAVADLQAWIERNKVQTDMPALAGRLLDRAPA
jgi:predicted DNA-binding transcriptional regulator AlpA